MKSRGSSDTSAVHFGRSTVLTLACAALALSACGSEPEFPENPQPSATYTAPQPTVTATATAPVPAGCDPVQSAAFSSIFQGRATTEAKGMELEGGPVCGSATEGGTVTGNSFFLQPGMCYVVLANGLPNVSEVDVQIVMDPTAIGIPPALAALASAPLAVDSDTGAMAGIGVKGCYKWPWPVPGAVKVVVKSRTGSGPVGAQVYRKKG
jgi:hypothetical protein